MIDSIVYSYIDKNFTLKYITSIEVCYIYDFNGERKSPRTIFSEIKTVFCLNEIDAFDVYAQWVSDKKEAMLIVC